MIESGSFIEPLLAINTLAMAAEMLMLQKYNVPCTLYVQYLPRYITMHGHWLLLWKSS